MKLRRAETLVVSLSGGSRQTVSGWSWREPFDDGRLPPVVHRGVWGDKGWTVTDPSIGIAYFAHMPTRTAAIKAWEAVKRTVARYRVRAA